MVNTLKKFGDITNKWVDASVKLKEGVEKAYHSNINSLLETIKKEIELTYKIHYQDEDTIQIKVDRRKNIQAIQTEIKEIVDNAVGDPKVANILFRYRLLEGMIVIQKRR